MHETGSVAIIPTTVLKKLTPTLAPMNWLKHALKVRQERNIKMPNGNLHSKKISH